MPTRWVRFAFVAGLLTLGIQCTAGAAETTSAPAATTAEDCGYSATLHATAVCAGSKADEAEKTSAASAAVSKAKQDAERMACADPKSETCTKAQAETRSAGKQHDTDDAMAKRLRKAADDAASKVQDAAIKVALVTLIVLIAIVVVLAKKTEILRDGSPQGLEALRTMAGDPALPKLRRPFSLAQTQMTWWFLIILASFVYLFVLNGMEEIPAINQAALWLMGLAAATGAGASVVDNTKTNPNVEAYNALVKRISDNALKNVPPVPADYTERDRLAKLLSSTNFLVDILTDVDGISLHRFQAAIWAVVVGIVYVIEVLNHSQMPTVGAGGFDTNLLIVLGIGNGTYLGLKVNEKPN